MADIQTIAGKIELLLDNIENAKYGQYVRTSIVAALTEIANEIDTSLKNMDAKITQASDIVNGDSVDTYRRILDEANTATDNLQNLQTVANKINAALNGIKNIRTTVIPYNNNNIQGLWNGEGGSYPKLISTETDTGINWEFQTLRVPQFKTVKVNRLDYNKLNDKTEFRNSVNYDPNEGLLELNIADPLSRLQIHVKEVIQYDPNRSGNLPVEFEYDANGIPHINLTLMRGKPGVYGGAVNFRPFIRRILRIWEDFNVSGLNYTTEKPSGGQFPFEGYLNHVKNELAHSYDAFSLNHEASPAFDAIIVVFKKSPNFSSLGDAFNSGITFSDNSDYNSGTSVFIPRGGMATAMMVDKANRMITRDVYWLDGTYSLNRYCWNTKTKESEKKNEEPKTLLVKSTETAPSGATLVKNYGGPGLFFGHAKVDGKGDYVDWAWQSDGVYAQTALSGSKFDPATNRHKNEAYDQFLIPTEVYGVLYQMWDEDVNDFIGTAI